MILSTKYIIILIDFYTQKLEARSQNFNNIIQSERELFTKCSNFLIRLDHSTLTETRISDSFYIPEQDYLIELCNIDPKNDVKPILREILESISTHSKEMEDDITSEKFQKQQVVCFIFISNKD